MSEKVQRQALEAAGVTVIYVDGHKNETIEVCLQSLRAKDELWVASLDRIAKHKKELRRLCDYIKYDRKAIIVEALSKRRSDNVEEWDAMKWDAIEGLGTDRKRLTHADAVRYGAMGGRVPIVPEMPELEARKIWEDVTLTSREAADKIGVDLSKAYRWLGKRGLAVGRPTVRMKHAHEADMVMGRVSKVYFLLSADKRSVKIGVSKQLDLRLSSLRIGSDGHLKLLAAVAGTRKDERLLHAKFIDYHKRGEWFRYEGELKKYIDGLPRVRPADLDNKK